MLQAFRSQDCLFTGYCRRTMSQRDVPVREVHHRIKNSLQGVTGLLRRFAAAHPPHCDPCLAIADKDAVPVALALNEIVVNPGRLPAGFNQATGSGNGNGLQLIRMLLPPQGTRFNLREQEGEVVALLRLTAPVIVPL